MSYLHHIRPRYGEIDMQGIVFNAHYLAYCDDATDSWFRSMFGDYDQDTWDIALKRADLTWHGPVRLGDQLEIDVAATRFGNTSLDIGMTGMVAGEVVFEATITYVCVDRGTSQPVPVPDIVRSKLQS